MSPALTHLPKTSPFIGVTWAAKQPHYDTKTVKKGNSSHARVNHNYATKHWTFTDLNTVVALTSVAADIGSRRVNKSKPGLFPPFFTFRSLALVTSHDLLTHFAPWRPSLSFLVFLTWQRYRGIKPDLQSSVMDEAGQKSGVLMCFQQLVKGFRMEKKWWWTKKKKERMETRPWSFPTRFLEGGVKDHVCLKNKNTNLKTWDFHYHCQPVCWSVL